MAQTCGDNGGKKRHTGEPCGQAAGWGTDHPREGKCKLHGGSSPGRPITHGRYSLKHRKELQKKMERFVQDPEPSDLRGELALMRALLQDYLERFEDPLPLTYESVKHIFDMAEIISKLVERIDRILVRDAFTAAEFQFLHIRLTDLLMKYIDDPTKRLQFLDEFRASAGTPRLGAGDIVDAPTGEPRTEGSELA